MENLGDREITKNKNKIIIIVLFRLGFVAVDIFILHHLFIIYLVDT
jgi:hypothetical protein